LAALVVDPHKIRALIEWRCTRDDIRLIHEALKADIARPLAAVDALGRALQGEKDKPIDVSKFWIVIKPETALLHLLLAH
jgi:hypothetical protein